MTKEYRAIPIFMVCSPEFAWPGERILAIFYSEEEANDYIRNEYNPFLYIRTNYIYSDDSRDSSTE
jgi:hypothetical protein